MTNFSSLRFESADGIATLTFATPESLNAITDARLMDLEHVLTDLEGNASVRALIISGEGRAFCVGLDLSLLHQAFSTLDYFEKVVRRLYAIIQRVEALPIPTIAAINGFARAGGFELALACDFILIANEARMGDVHTDAGVLPACVSTRLVRRVGMAKAKEIIWSAQWLKGQEAVDCGLAQQAVPLSELANTARQFARRFTNKPRATVAYSKNTLHAARDLPLDAASELELQIFMKYMRGESYGVEGYRAFVEKRTPHWKLGEST